MTGEQIISSEKGWKGQAHLMGGIEVIKKEKKRRRKERKRKGKEKRGGKRENERAVRLPSQGRGSARGHPKAWVSQRQGLGSPLSSRGRRGRAWWGGLSPARLRCQLFQQGVDSARAAAAGDRTCVFVLRAVGVACVGVGAA